MQLIRSMQPRNAPPDEAPPPEPEDVLAVWDHEETAVYYEFEVPTGNKDFKRMCRDAQAWMVHKLQDKENKCGGEHPEAQC